MQNHLLAILCLVAHLSVAAQALENPTPNSDMLDEVTVSGEKERSTSDFTNATPYKADSTILREKGHTSIADLITQSTPFVVKQNGNGMMTTISLRGTSASHTQTLWNGINISPLTMGQTDYSLIPVFFFDQIEIYPGGESSVFGNGTIGGAVTLTSKPDWSNRFKISLQTDHGSYQKDFNGLKMNIGNEKVQNHTVLFHQRCENNFTFHFRDEEFRQKNAAYKSYGILNETDVKINSRNTLGASIWHTLYDRRIQPMMQNNEDPSKYEDITDQSSKVILRHEGKGKWITWRNKAAWNNDREHYKEDLIATHDISVASNVRKDMKKSTIEAGGDIQYIHPEVDAYQAGTHEWRGSIFLLSRFRPSSKLTLHGNIRKGFASNIHIPLSPSLGIYITPMRLKKNDWGIGCNISKNTKIPNLNDRYWGHLGNIDLNPENALNWEVKCHWNTTLEHYRFTSGVTLYRNDVDNWIMWMPRGIIWKPINIERVLAKGIESGMTHAFPISRVQNKISIRHNYSFTEIKAGFVNIKPFIGHQMPLLPQHTLSGRWLVQQKRTSFSLNAQYTGERTSSDIYDIMPAYLLWNLYGEFRIPLRKKKCTTCDQEIILNGQINNLFDTDYQNIPYRVMPGRNFSIGAQWKLGLKK